MQPRPTFIDLRSSSTDSIARPGVPSPRSAQLSPRMQHFAGDVPPAMSPLDMFAMHSRMLAKQLDDSQRDGRRVSRLPPLSNTDPITHQRSMYDRSRSNDNRKVLSPPLSSPRSTKDEDHSGFIPEVEEPQFRPKSFYPRMSTVRPDEDEDGSEDLGRENDERPDSQLFFTPLETHVPKTMDYFGGPQTTSPESATAKEKIPDIPDRQAWLNQSRGQTSQQPSFDSQRGFSTESTSSKSYSSSLAPPNVTRSPHTRQSPSIRSIPQDSSDDELSASTGGSGFSRNRKLSSSSNISLPHSPFSPFAQAAHARSPSLNSEYSLGGTLQARPAFNFSRPLSRGSRPSMDVNSRQPSFDSRPSFDAVRPPFSSNSRQHSNESQQRVPYADSTVHTPTSMDHEDVFNSKDNAAPSYIYAKYSLPRGRVIQRDNKGVDNNQVPLFEWDRPVVQTNVRPTTPLANRPMSPSSSSQYSPRPSMEQRNISPRPSFEQRNLPSPRPSIEKSRLNPNRPPPTPITNDDQSEYSASTRSGSTIKASSRPHQPAPVSDVSPEDHLAKGIALHERGEIKESTYHLRIAAKHNLPTAMLLYALACRHGWGMRPNPQEGVAWLRKAADSASIEIATDDDNTTGGGDISARKQRKAQFAYAIYELGVSHMNGLGLEPDKTLALRCFEIAASWGDADAMAESGFCYAEGQGCKKDLKKAAKYYKMAEAKGVSMVGNSWYVTPFRFCSRQSAMSLTAYSGSISPNTMMWTTKVGAIVRIGDEVKETQRQRKKRSQEINQGHGRYSAARNQSLSLRVDIPIGEHRLSLTVEEYVFYAALANLFISGHPHESRNPRAAISSQLKFRIYDGNGLR